ncbi:N-acetylglutaminylglutamine amidotransferase [Tistrella mobilis]
METDMCGFSGEIRFDGTTADVGAVARMTAAMDRRGPDASGIHAQGRIAVGHRRLKIFDLSEQAQQPMIDAGLGLGLVYNGAIYNYRELRAELEAMGFAFFSTGDTEVILKGYRAWGPKVVDRLAGMFAFVLWERDTGRVLMARDRLGIKPLYIENRGRTLRFASTLPALLAGGGVDTAIDPVALQFYLQFHAVVPAPMTILKGIRKLPPATRRIIEPDGTARDEVYWAPDYGPRADERDLSFQDWQAKVLDSLRTAVRRRLVADVPVGVLLSGGLDSSLITGLIAEAGQKDLKTYSIGFDAAGGEEGDEFRWSDVVAAHFGTDHHQIRVSASETLEALPDCVAAMSEPMVSHDAVGFYLLSQAVSRDLKVVQSGQGADEVFGGYHWYPPMLAAGDEAAVETYARHFCDRAHDEYLGLVRPEHRVDEDHARRFVAEHFAQPGATRPIDKALRIDSNIMLVDDPVKRVDNMTMSWGLEARVPFLDHELVELAARVPAEMKVKTTPDGRHLAQGKYVLAEAARAVIPHAVIDRPKGYFPVPALKHLEGPYLEMVRASLGSEGARSRGLFDQAAVDRLLADPKAHITPLRGSKLWQLALLELWLDTHGIRG